MNGTVATKSTPNRPANFVPTTSQILVNDIHSDLNPTWVRDITTPGNLDQLQRCIRGAANGGMSVAICGARHAMGGQQFASEEQLINMRNLNRVLAFDPVLGQIECEAGIQWPKLVGYLLDNQTGQSKQWGIRQKQTGADNLTLGGAVAANVHGRGLCMRPIVEDIESLVVIDVRGDRIRVSREETPNLFSLVVGGYGLFGVVYSVTLRLSQRQKLRRSVIIIEIDEAAERFDSAIGGGALYGDFQFSTDESNENFLRSGVLSCYTPVAIDTPIPENQRVLSEDDWRKLVYLSHADKGQAYDLYSQHYGSTDGQIYWSDTHQMSTYLEGYHTELDQRLGATCAGSEIISELYVPRNRLTSFMNAVRADCQQHSTNIIYGTVRLIERDEETFLGWAREPWACIVFNLHTDHTCAALERTADAFRRLITRATECGGSFYLTYHRYATRDQLLKCYPQLPEFLQQKQQLDSEERFRSDWYDHINRTILGR